MTERSTLPFPVRPELEPASAPPTPLLAGSARRSWVLLVLLWVAVYGAALFSPSLLDDADATHANAAQSMARTGDWVTLYVNGVRYLEKPPLPYWLVALDYHVFGFNVFSTHLPQTLAVLLCAWLGWLWARRAFGDRAGFYTAAAFLSTVGVFLYTRFFIPESILCFLLAAALYTFFTALEDRKPGRLLWTGAALGVALLTKGLIAPVFFLGAAGPYLLLTGQWRRWRELPWVQATLVMLAIAAPWHLMAALRNPDQGHPHGNVPTFGNVHGFLYFYFINEHFLRFLGLRYPHDYNKQPWWVFWVGHLVWLFPWSLFFPAAIARAWQHRRTLRAQLRDFSGAPAGFRARSALLLALFGAWILLFFSLSTNQEYYTFPAYFPLLLLAAGALAATEESGEDTRSPSLLGAHGVFACVGLLSAAALAYGLWASRKLPFVPDIGTLLAHRGVGDYSLSMSHFFDLTGPSFAALRTPATVAAVTLLCGPLLAFGLRRRGHGFEATVSTALTAAAFLVAAHSALVRFQPLLSSRVMADTVNRIVGQGPGLGLPGARPGESGGKVIVYGDLTNFSSVLFYTGREAVMINGRISSMIWGSDYPDVPHVFLEDADLTEGWGQGAVRQFLLVPPESRAHVEQLLGGKLVLLQEVSDRTLYTDRPL
jgi:4-amino-4-deoxy-L-arabinose transferase-like glycosyltransferase